MNPKISVIVPCYNQAKYLPETLRSVSEQLYTDWECIIVNDGSPDNTEDIALEWCKKDDRFKYLAKENTGISDTRNYGIKHADGEFILPLDSDDKISPEYIQEGLKIFDKSPETKLVYCDMILFGAVSKKLTLPEFVYENMFLDNQIFCSAIFRKSDFLETQGYNVNMAEGLEDWDFYLSFLNKNDKVVKLNGFYFYYRIKDISRSKQIDHDKNEKLLLQIFNNHIPLFLEYFNPLREHIKAKHYKKISDQLYNSTEYKIGRIIYSPVKFTKKIFRKLLFKKN